MSAIRRLLDRMPRPMWQAGIKWNEQNTDWGFILQNHAEVLEEKRVWAENKAKGFIGDEQLLFRRVWMSPAKLEALPEFTGW